MLSGAKDLSNGHDLSHPLPMNMPRFSICFRGREGKTFNVQRPTSNAQ